MSTVQRQFELFDEQIMLGRFEENAILREKRDIIRSKLKERLPGAFEQHEEKCPEYYWRDQGSYEMGTGIIPLEGDYDIDQGLYFMVSTDSYPDPVVLKKRVYEALDGHTSRVEVRRPCVTVFYQCEEEPIYHVDIAVYSDGSKNPDGKSRIAKGKEHSTEEYRFWELSDPQALKDCIFARFEGNDRAQFRRIVRYLKRWKNVNFPSNGHAAPLGIGLTVSTYDNLQPAYADLVAGKPDDLTALRNLIDAILGHFTSIWDTEKGTWIRRLAVRLPVEPGNDLFEQMTDGQVREFEGKLMAFKEILDAVSKEADPVEACRILGSVLGKDFPVPAKEETAVRHAPAIASSSNSA